MPLKGQGGEAHEKWCSNSAVPSLFISWNISIKRNLFHILFDCSKLPFVLERQDKCFILSPCLKPVFKITFWFISIFKGDRLALFLFLVS